MIKIKKIKGYNVIFSGVLCNNKAILESNQLKIKNLLRGCGIEINV